MRATILVRAAVRQYSLCIPTLQQLQTHTTRGIVTSSRLLQKPSEPQDPPTDKKTQDKTDPKAAPADAQQTTGTVNSTNVTTPPTKHATPNAPPMAPPTVRKRSLIPDYGLSSGEKVKLPPELAKYATYPTGRVRFSKFIERTPGKVIPSDRFTVEFENQSREFDSLWLRDNCRCEECYDPVTRQRMFLPHERHRTARPQSSRFDPYTRELDVVWADGHASRYDIDWLFDNSYNQYKNTSHTERFLWDGKSIQFEDIGDVEYDKLLNTKDDAALKEVLESMWKYGVAFVSEVPPTIEDTAKASRRLGLVRNTVFGQMWTFTSDMQHRDSAYTSQKIGPHTDNTYFTTPSGVQIFHCLSHDGEGGETVLVDGFRAAETLRREEPQAFTILSTRAVRHKYQDSGSNIQSLGTILQVDPVTKHMRMVRYNHYDRAAIDTIPQNQVAEYYTSLAKLSDRMENDDLKYRFKLHPGRMLLVDNWRVLHAREAFTGSRTMCGCYLSADDWRSQLRIKLGKVFS